MPGMAVPLAIFGVAFAAFCVWVGVRVINRRERSSTLRFLSLAGAVGLGPFCIYWSYFFLSSPPYRGYLDETIGPFAFVAVPALLFVAAWLYICTAGFLLIAAAKYARWPFGHNKDRP
jgi:hypothetical protein